MKIPGLLFALAVAASGAPPVIDDAGLVRGFQQKLGEMADKGGLPTGEELAAALKKAPKQAAPELAECPGRPEYAEAVEGVVLLGSVQHCNDPDGCKKWHLGPVASAWCVGAAGLFITNHHCFADAKGAVHGICTIGGRVAAVREVIAGDPRSDVCLFRVDGDGFTALPLGEPAAVGAGVRVISHPEGRFFTQTSGEVARYFRRPGRGALGASTWMSITADYAKGSSGGPVLDECGAVVGMVSSTQSIYYGGRNKKEQGPLQMVVKNCVPGAALRELVGR